MDTRLQLRCEMGQRIGAVGWKIDGPQIDVDRVVFREGRSISQAAVRIRSNLRNGVCAVRHGGSRTQSGGDHHDLGDLLL